MAPTPPPLPPLPLDVSELMVLYQDTHGVRGHNFKLARKSSMLDLRKYALTNRVVNIWNGLPTSVVNEKSMKDFEPALHEHWANQDIKFDFKLNVE